MEACPKKTTLEILSLGGFGVCRVHFWKIWDQSPGPNEGQTSNLKKGRICS